MIPRFHYHGEAVGLAGRLTLPFDEVIPIQASCALAGMGGYGSVRIDNFRHREIISAHSVYSQVSGAFSQKDDSFDTLVTVTVEGLNVLNVVTADAIVARITSKHPNDASQEPSITPTGSYFRGLRIAGEAVECDLATDTFAKFDTVTKVRAAYQANTDSFRTEFNALTLWGQASTIPAALRVYFPWATVPAATQIPAARWLIPGTLLRGVQPAAAAPLLRVGHVIQVPGFGVVRLAEIRISQKRLHLNMLRINFGSVPEGEFMCAAGEGNGSDW
ncbi:MAG: hypothetical protein IT161_06950 [Bryobacterales bacterium]|nr:hypothetical protein [Bryobacterales bacterium]